MVGNFEPKKITSNFNALVKSIISNLGVSYFPFVFLDSVKPCYLQKTHTVTSLECAHSIMWHKQKRRRNRWASKQVSRLYLWSRLCSCLVCFFCITKVLKSICKIEKKEIGACVFLIFDLITGKFRYRNIYVAKTNDITISYALEAHMLLILTFDWFSIKLNS